MPLFYAILLLNLSVTIRSSVQDVSGRYIYSSKEQDLIVNPELRKFAQGFLFIAIVDVPMQFRGLVVIPTLCVTTGETTSAYNLL